jgi:hypothetical protein
LHKDAFEFSGSILVLQVGAGFLKNSEFFFTQGLGR